MRNITLAAALIIAPLAATNAQSCVGIPNEGMGILAFGISGTDGATGTTWSLGHRTSRTTFLVNRTSLETGMIDAMTSWAGHVALRVGKSNVCVVSGLEVGRFDTQLEENVYWAYSDHAGGQYFMYAVPILVQAGSTHQLFDVNVQPFALSGAVVQSEHFFPRNGAITKRAQVVPRVGVGLTLSAKRLVIQGTLTNDNGPDHTLAGWHNFASIRVSAGFRY